MTINNNDIPYEDKIQLPTIRDQFAMAALAFMDFEKLFYELESIECDYKFIAREVYNIADAMLEARAE
jgi:hypothetical protein